MKLTITVDGFKRLERGTLRGFCDIVIKELRLKVHEVALHQKGLFTWPEWAEALAAEIAAAKVRGEADDGHGYYDHWLAALEALLSEWDSDDGYAARVRALFGNGGTGENGNTQLNDQTVINDLAVNDMNGGSGMDWLWLEGATDMFTGAKAGEVVTLK